MSSSAVERRRRAVASVRAQLGLAQVITDPYRWVPHQPTPRQKLWLDLVDCREALYGGAAGGGKTDAILMSHLRYFDVPGYSGLVVMRSYADLSKPKAAMDRAHDWLSGSGATWNGDKKQWRSPAGAILSFGYLETADDKHNYRSAEYQQITPDEVSRFDESSYTFLFSRLRRLKTANVPILMRPATNPPEPGEPGAAWVKQRFLPEDWEPRMAESVTVYWKEGIDARGRVVTRAFVPARLEDNPFLDQEEYEESLSNLDAARYQALRQGDWDAVSRGNIYPTWTDGPNSHHVITWSEFEKVFGVRHIPTHWLGAQGHDSGYDPDPRASVWNWRAAENSGLGGKIFAPREFYSTRVDIDSFADFISEAEAPLSEASRIQYRVMSHEQSSEQATLRRRGYDFQKTKPDVLGGIAQMRHALRIKDLDKPNPFRPWLKGCPDFMVVVDDREIEKAKTSAGMVNFRAEIAAYRYIEPNITAQKGMPRIVPYDFFNHLMDAQRMIAARWFAPIVEKTLEERTEDAMPQHLKQDFVAAQPYDPMLVLARQTAYENTKRQIEEAEMVDGGACSGWSNAL